MNRCIGRYFGYCYRGYLGHNSGQKHGGPGQQQSIPLTRGDNRYFGLWYGCCSGPASRYRTRYFGRS